jgi:hypothetical protein
MTKRTLQLLLFTWISTLGAMGQLSCASGSPSAQKLVCQIPFSTGVFSNAGNTSGTASAIANATAFNSAIATQVSQLPLSSASSGTVVLYRAGVPETYNNLGPILTDRAQTVGKHKLFLGFSASQFYFTDIDGISLNKVPYAYEADGKDANGNVISRTYTEENQNIHFKVNQYIFIGTFGLTNRVDVTMIVPVERVSVGAATSDGQGYLFNTNNMLVLNPYAVPPTYVPGTASGVGDIVFNAKGALWRGEHATFSGGMNVRTPTGDDQNYLGSGAWGFNPYVVFSYLAKVSPHARIGYQWNTSTELNNPTLTPGGNQSLPGGVQYDVGADWAWLRHLTLAGDLLGSQYLNASTLVRSSIVLPTNSSTPSLPTVTTTNSSYTINDVSAGLKWNPYRNLVLSANVLFQLNDVGLRTRPAPLLGISYKF